MAWPNGQVLLFPFWLSVFFPLGPLGAEIILLLDQYQLGSSRVVGSAITLICVLSILCDIQDTFGGGGQIRYTSMNRG
jgi:hypothetical protein